MVNAGSGFFVRGSLAGNHPPISCQTRKAKPRRPSGFTGIAGTNPPSRSRRAKSSSDSARATDRPVARQSARPHPKARRKRRRHVVKRSAAVAAALLRLALDAQPMPARRTLRIQTLNRPTRQILHQLPRKSQPGGGGNCKCRRGSPYYKNPSKLRGLCAGVSCESRKIYTISWGAVPKLWKITKRRSRPATGRCRHLRSSNVELLFA